MNQCAWCASHTKCSRCVQCMSKYYCRFVFISLVLTSSNECAVKDWKAGHKDQCKRMALDNEEACNKLRVRKQPVDYFKRSMPRTNTTHKQNHDHLSKIHFYGTAMKHMKRAWSST